jgi:hypothetical protein
MDFLRRFERFYKISSFKESSLQISINLFFYGKEVANNKKYKILRLFNITASLGGGALNENIAYENVLFDTHLA